MSNGIFGDLFDVNGNGNMDGFEHGLELWFLNQVLEQEIENDDGDNNDDDLVCELESWFWNNVLQQDDDDFEE